MKERREVEPGRFYILSADIEAHGHTGGCPGCAALASHGRATKPHIDECRERIRTIIERTLTVKARMNAYKDRIAETERVKERKRARVERGAGDVPAEPGNRDDEQVAVRQADASGSDIRENQHEEDRMRDIHVGKRGSEAASEEQADKLRKTVRFEQEAPSASACSDPTVVNSTPHTSHFLVFHSTHFACHIDIGSRTRCVAHFTSSHLHALMMCCFDSLRLYDSPFYSLLSIFSLIFLFILLIIFIFHVGYKNPAHFCE